MPSPAPEIVIATRSAGKVREFTALFGQHGIVVKSLLDFPELPEIPEDGITFAENAAIKARTLAAHLGLPAIADDSGLCVDALGGAPGVYSARYAGEPSDDAANNRKLLDELQRLFPAGAPQAEQGTPERLSSAQFVCSMVLVDAEGRVSAESEGVCPGYILREPRGSGGFGYDPLFFLPEYGRTMAELTLEQKNAVSHRGQALGGLMAALRQQGGILS